MLKFLFPALIVFLWYWPLKFDLQRDPGSHRRTKILHVLAMVLLLPHAFGAPGAFSSVTGFFRDGGTQTYGGLFAALLFASTAATFGAMFLLGPLSRRASRGRRVATFAYPLIGVVTSAGFLHAYFSESSEPIEGLPPAVEAVLDWSLAVVSVSIILIVHCLPALFYRGRAAIEFFAPGPLTKEHIAAATSARPAE